ncbi:hypothetical protein QTO34_009573 [Cnephaeus nilssonii]|uniref:Transmembrane protein 95 n=1 Tax=Cnephaeus nilssonii TaxID=3371016 RepID=A0AA40HI11_CNENI|nr:hypothetical protein QTO34_009573 [Eptesicus nilssonii]
MWMLALAVALLEAAQACLFCRLPAHGLSGRLAWLCSQIEAQWKDCEASWNFSTFALDEVSMNKVTEKTHRVLRVMEIKSSFSSLPLYWQWLQRTKFPEYNREGTDGRRDHGVPRAWAKGCVAEVLIYAPLLVLHFSSLQPRLLRAWQLAGGSGTLEGGAGASPPSSGPASPAGGSTVLYNCSTCAGFEEVTIFGKPGFCSSVSFGTILFLGVLSLVVEFHFLEAKSNLRRR